MDLPNEVMQLVFLGVPVTSLASVGCVCKRWKELLDDENGWKKRTCQSFDIPAEVADTTSCWKSLFKSYYSLHWETDHDPSDVVLSCHNRKVEIKSSQKTVLANKVFTTGLHSWTVVPALMSNSSWIGIADPNHVDYHSHLNSLRTLGWGVGSSGGKYSILPDIHCFDSGDHVQCHLDMQQKTFAIDINGTRSESNTFRINADQVSPAVSNNLRSASFWIQPMNPTGCNKRIKLS